MLNFEAITVNDLSRILKLDSLIFTTPSESKNVHLDRLKTFPFGCFILTVNGNDVGYFETEIWDNFHEPKENIHASKFHNSNEKILYLSNMGLLPNLRGRGGAVKF